MSFQAFSDQQVLTILGRRLRDTRLRQNLTQIELAERASLSVSTIKGLEEGRGRLDSLVAVLRELRQLDALDAFLPSPELSPLELARRRGRPRKRASGSRKKPPSSSGKPSSW